MKALVTGGGGFLGGAIVRRLQAGGARVRSYSRGVYPDLEARGVACFRGDLASSEGKPLVNAVDGCDIVFHVAAKAGIWGSRAEYHDANVVGTRNIIAACRETGVPRLVYTSSPSVVFDGEDQNGVDESEPYPDRYLAHYPRTKGQAEREVLGASEGSLLTVALRPHLIWGPGDNHLVPRIIEQARAGRLRLVGRRENAVDSVYIDNAAEAHLLAGERLTPGSPVVGKAYFISNGEPIPMARLINRILKAAHEPPVTRTIPAGIAYTAGAILEALYTILKRDGEPPMTRFLARQLSTAHWFDLRAARRDLGYEPKVSIDEGMKRLETWLHRKERQAS